MPNRLWGGHFKDGPAAIMEEINASIGFDRRLFRQDIAASRAHARMLGRQGIIAADDAEKIVAGLDTILREIEADRFAFDRALEDIHTHVEARLKQLVGPAGGRLHTARSRNDQVATDFRLWIRDAVDDVDEALADLQAALAEKALAAAASPTPGSASTKARSARLPLPARRSRSTAPSPPKTSASPVRWQIRSTASPTATSRWRRCRPPRSPPSISRVWLRRSSSGRRPCSASSSYRTASPPALRSCRRSGTPTPPNWCAPRSAASSAP